jgi:hypothetical protein
MSPLFCSKQSQQRKRPGGFSVKSETSQHELRGQPPLLVVANSWARRDTDEDFSAQSRGTCSLDLEEPPNSCLEVNRDMFDDNLSAQGACARWLMRPPNKAMKLTGASRRQLIARALGGCRLQRRGDPDDTAVESLQGACCSWKGH